ncbi:unnamed protein product [Allacma fusca]|uniref:Uncharacterized protein n=1 Tax=Allacma fusca TaxID=39272 RepID=A0A8J2KXS2_9HEXA|nr:unnamed protein product [Allacma fusca]
MLGQYQGGYHEIMSSLPGHEKPRRTQMVPYQKIPGQRTPSKRGERQRTESPTKCQISKCEKDEERNPRPNSKGNQTTLVEKTEQELSRSYEAV